MSESDGERRRGREGRSMTDDETGTGPDASSGSTGSPDTTTDSPPNGCSRHADPRCEAGGSPPSSRDTDDARDHRDAVALPPAPAVELDVYPSAITARDAWLPWSNWDRKQPNASAYSDAENPYSWSDPANWTSFEHAGRVEHDTDAAGIGFVLQDRADPYADDPGPDPCCVIDYDDARDPETGAIHPVVREHVERAGSYADVSHSATGVHVPVIGALPDGVRTIDDDLPYHPDFPDASIEVYDGKRFMAFTGRHIEGTPRDVCDAQAFVDELAAEFVTVAEATPDGLTRDPEKTRAELADVETTTEIQDVLDAIQHTGPGDVRLRSPVTEQRADGSRSLDPSWDPSDRGDKLAEFADGWVLRDGMIGLDALQVVALEERIVTSEDEYPSGEAFWNAVDALRERGAHVPEYDGSAGEDTEHVAVLPESPRARAAANGWAWQSADRTGVDDALTIDDARERTTEAIAGAYQSGNRALVEALPTMGKSHGAIAAAAETGAPITVLTGRGNEEQYEQIEAWCAKYDLKAKVLPSVYRDCETFAGEHGEGIEATVKNWYRRGATGKDIHKDAEYELGEPLPCDGPAGRRCSYKIGWEFDPDEFDVLIGNYLHGHVGSATQGRTIVVDEFPGDAFETTLGTGLAGAVTAFLKRHGALPFDDHADLIENRRDEQRRADALAWFGDHAPDRDGTLAFESTDGHAAAPLATFVILAGAKNGLGNGWERTTLPGFANGVGLHDRENGRVHLLTPPDLRYTRGVVALDGTPTPALWELALGTRLNHRPVLSDAERAEYVRDALGLNIVRTTDAVKPYSGSGEHVATRQDHALIEAIGDEHDRRPSLLTTQTAKDVYRDAGVLDDVRDVDHYGNLKGSNKYASERLGAVIGSRHFGDGFVQKWGAFAGEAIGDPDRSDAETRGRELSYGGLGDDVLRHMREYETLQAVMRFGRDGRGATVYVHTNTLPTRIEDDDDPVLAGEGRVIRTWSDGMRQVLDAARDLGATGEGWTTGEIADHPAVEIGERQVRDHLHRLARRGYVDVEIEGTGFVWRNDGLHRVGEHGEVELEAVDVAELDETESAELSRSSSYTWEFRRSPGERGRSPTDSLETRCAFRPSPADGGEPPPDRGG